MNMMHVDDCLWTSTKQKSNLCSGQWTGYSHLGLLVSGLRFVIKMTVFGNSPFGCRGSVVPSSLSPSLGWLTLLPGHCVHSLSVTISSQLYEAHYFNVPPGGDVENSALAKKTLLSSDDWPSTEISLSISPFLDLPPSPLCLLSTSVFNFPPSSRKRMNWDDISALGKAPSEQSVHQLWELDWLLITL